MQRYRVDEDLDEYEDDVEDQYEDVDEDQYEDEEDDEEEEEQEEKPLSEEAIKYLESRERLKAKHRSILRRENGKNGVNVNHSKLMNFGSFFGPSKPVIADRVIQERKSLSETRHLAPKVSTSQNDMRKVSMPSTSTPRNGLTDKPYPRQVTSKAQIIKQTRDYSFLLSDDADIPKPAKDPASRKSLAPKPGLEDAKSAPTREKKYEHTHSGKKRNDGCEQRNPSSGLSQVHDAWRAPPQKSTSCNRASLPCDSRRQLELRKQTQANKQAGTSNGSGSRPTLQKVLPSKKPFSSSDRKMPAGTAERKPSASPVGIKASVVAKTSSLDQQRRPMVKPQSSSVNSHLEHRRDVQRSSENRLDHRRDVRRSSENKTFKKENVAASKSQMMKPPKQGSLQSNVEKRHHIKQQSPAGQFGKSSAAINKDHRIKKRKAPESDDEELDVRSVIRQMFRRPGRPTQYYDDDDDDKDMEVGFDAIMDEELKSARIAKKEDDEEFIKIQEEERQEMLRKKAKMRKMMSRR